VHSAADLSFDAATASHPTGDPTIWGIEVHTLWTVGDKPNGGYLQALLGRAARLAGGGEGWEPVASSLTYLRPPELGPAEIHTRVLRQGRSAAHVRAVMVQGGAELVDGVFVLSELPEAAPARYDDIRPLRVPDPEDCRSLPPLMPGGVRVGIMEVLDLRLDPASLPSGGEPTAEGAPAAELRGWTRFADGREIDALSLLFFVDAIPPATMRIGSTGWVPTLQMATYLRARPAPGWLGIRLTAGLVAGGMVDEICTLWDSTGAVVAQATQLARLRFPDDA
jgi:hypothetical protein